MAAAILGMMRSPQSRESPDTAKYQTTGAGEVWPAAGAAHSSGAQTRPAMNDLGMMLGGTYPKVRGDCNAPRPRVANQA
jgi:hypothetical protein